MAQKKKIKYQVEFELLDFDEFKRSYPNFIYNYSSFEEWAQSNMDYMKASIDDIGGYRLTIKKED